MNNKQRAVTFLKLVVSGKIDDAYKKYIDMKGKHHNMFFPAGFPALLKAMKEAHKQFPQKKFTIKHIFGADDLVAVHSQMILKPADPGIQVVHMFCFKNKKIIEMWDCGQEIPKDSPNKDGAF